MWRPGRSEHTLLGAVLGAFAAVLLLTGAHMHPMFNAMGLSPCRPAAQNLPASLPPQAGGGSSADPITLGVVWGALQSLCVEIGSSVQRTAYSIQAREGQDFSVAVFDAQGRMSAQGPYSPGHMGAMNFAIRNFMDAFPADNVAEVVAPEPAERQAPSEPVDELGPEVSLHLLSEVHFERVMAATVSQAGLPLLPG